MSGRWASVTVPVSPAGPGAGGRAVDDRAAMARAVALAERGRATVRPNPLVGCVLVRGGRLVAAGWHERPGGPHAEAAALRVAGDGARGATAVVTLEPCGHHGRTGPCADLLVSAGVGRVVYAVAEPHPDRGGARRLREAGIPVETGLLAPWVEAQNEVFLHCQRTGRPFLTLKLAQTRQDSLTAPAGRWITSREARTAVHRVRALSDAVLVGSGTVLADDPRLTVRHVQAAAGQPRPVVLDARGRTPAGAAVVRPGALVVTAPGSDPRWRAELAGRGAEVVEVPVGPAGGVDLPAVLAVLADRGVQAVLAEGGGTLASALVREGLVDRLLLHVATSAAGQLAGSGITRAAAVRPGGATARWRVEWFRRLGPDREVALAPRRG